MPASDRPSPRRPSTRRVARLASRRASGGAAVLRPREVCTQLAVSPSTLRVWSTEFKDYLSLAAQVAPVPGRAHRRYTAADLQVLARIGQLLHLGHRCDEVKQLLPPPSGPPVRTESTEPDPRLANLEQALASARARIGALQEQAIRCERQLGAEQASHAETQGALLQAERKLAEAQRVNTWLMEANVGLHAQVALLEREVNAPVWKRVFQ